MSDEMQDEGLVEAALDEGGEIGGMPGDYENEPQDEPAVMVSETIVHEISESAGAWMDLFGIKDGRVMKIHIWQNAQSAEDALFSLLTTMKAAERWNLKPYEPEIPLPAKRAQPAQPATPTTPAVMAPAGTAMPLPPTQAAPVQQQPAQAAGGTFQIAKITVTPQPEGKVMVELFSAGHKWADLKAKGTPEQMVSKFPEGWTPAHFATAQTFDWPCVAYWTPSKNMDSTGKPYKNLAKVEAA